MVDTTSDIELHDEAPKRTRNRKKIYDDGLSKSQRYYRRNKEEIKLKAQVHMKERRAEEPKSELVTCEICKCTIRAVSMSAHLKTKKHLNNISGDSKPIEKRISSRMTKEEMLKVLNGNDKLPKEWIKEIEEMEYTDKIADRLTYYSRKQTAYYLYYEVWKPAQTMDDPHLKYRIRDKL